MEIEILELIELLLRFAKCCKLRNFTVNPVIAIELHVFGSFMKKFPTQFTLVFNLVTALTNKKLLGLKVTAV